MGAGDDHSPRRPNSRHSVSELNTIEEEPSLLGESEPSPNDNEEERKRLEREEEEEKKRASEERKRLEKEAARRREEEAKEERRRAEEERAKQREKEEEEKRRVAELERELEREREESERHRIQEEERRRAEEEQARRRREEEEKEERHRKAEEVRRREEEEAKRRAEEAAANERLATAGSTKTAGAALSHKPRRRSSSGRRSSAEAAATRQQLEDITNSSSAQGATRRANSGTRRNSSSGPTAATRRKPNTTQRRSPAESEMQKGSRPASASRNHDRDSSRDAVFRLGAHMPGNSAGVPPPVFWDEDDDGNALSARPYSARRGVHSHVMGSSGGYKRGLDPQDSDGELRFSPRSDGSDTPRISTNPRVVALRKIAQSAISGGFAKNGNSQQANMGERPWASPTRRAQAEASYTPMRSRGSAGIGDSAEPARSAASRSPDSRAGSAAPGSRAQGVRSVPGIASMPFARPPSAQSSRPGTGRKDKVPGLDLAPSTGAAPAPYPYPSAEVAAAEAAAKAAEAAAAAATAAIATPSTASAPGIPGKDRAVLAAGATGPPIVAEVEAAPAAPAGRRRIYRVLTAGLGVRVSPDVNAARTGAILRRGDIFEASVVAPGVDGRIYLKIAGARGWVFDDSAVDFNDPSVELVPEQELIAQLSAREAQSVKSGTPGQRPPSIAWGEVPSMPSGASGHGTPGRHGAAPAFHGPQALALPLRSLSDVGAHMPSPRSNSLGPPGPPPTHTIPLRTPPTSSQPQPPGHRATGGEHFSPSRDTTPRQRFHANVQNPAGDGQPLFHKVEFGRSQLGPGGPGSISPGAPQLSEEFRGAMTGSVYSMSRRRQVA